MIYVPTVYTWEMCICLLHIDYRMDCASVFSCILVKVTIMLYTYHFVGSCCSNLLYKQLNQTDNSIMIRIALV